MKELRNMLVINWHYFSHSLIPFKTLNFLTGQNAAGKSTLIDALQVVMLGETKSYIFNKAANDKSERTLIGYLKGELGDDGEAGFRYLREGDFNAYIVLEFFDTVKQKPFIAGVIFDVYNDGTQKHNYFLADCAIPENQFLNNDVPLNRDELKKSLQAKTGNRLGWFDTQNTYRNHLMGKCGNIKSKFFSLFKKAVPFSPIADIEQFITEFVTDIKGRPNIEEMQENLRSYKRLEKEAEAIKDRIVRLESIGDSHKTLVLKKRQKLMHEAISSLAKLRITIQTVESLHSTLSETQKLLHEKEQVQSSLIDEKEYLEKEKEELITEKANSDIQKKFNQIEEKSSRAEKEIQRLLIELSSTLKHIKGIAEKLLTLNENFLTEYELSILQKITSLTIESKHIVTENIIEIMDGILERWSNHYETIRHETVRKLEEDRNLLRQMKERLESLKKGIKDYPDDVKRLATHLKSRGVSGVHILADLLEVTDEKWQAAIEGYLHTQKFYLLVDPLDYTRALAILSELRQTKPVYGAGLIDVEKLASKRPVSLENALAACISTEHSGARLYVDYVLGQVICTARPDDLRLYPTAITESCLLYQNYVARQLHPDRWKVPYIGKRAIEQQIERLSEEIGVMQVSIVKTEASLSDYNAMCNIKAFSSVEKELHDKRFKSISQIIDLQDLMDALKLEKEGLDLMYLSKLDEKISAINDSIRHKNEEMRKTSEAIGALRNNKILLESKDIPEAQRMMASQQLELERKYFDSVRIEAGERFETLAKSQTIEEISINYARSAKAAETEQDKELKSLIELRGDYNRVYHMSHDVSGEHNHAYEEALHKLRDTNLPDYLTKIKEAQERATVQFRDEFLSKLKENFDSVFAQIKELNVAIKDSPFGTDKYKFEVKPKPEMRHFYEMIMDDLLMGSGMNIMSHAFNQKHGEAIDELFRMIVSAEDSGSSDKKSFIEKQIDFYTNYRSYLIFDFVVTDQNGDEQRLSKTLLKKSGGETQTPFYLAVLASFAHLYRVNQKIQGSETIRLIVFDEAFSKMDQQRIEESLKLLRRFKLQAIISAPPDKIMDISPHVDANICVFRANNVSFIQTYEQKALMQLIE